MGESNTYSIIILKNVYNSITFEKKNFNATQTQSHALPQVLSHPGYTGDQILVISAKKEVPRTIELIIN